MVGPYMEAFLMEFSGRNLQNQLIGRPENYPLRRNLILISMPFSFRAAVFNEFLSAKN